jgi:uncharacterized metal-binding protein
MKIHSNFFLEIQNLVQFLKLTIYFCMDSHENKKLYLKFLSKYFWIIPCGRYVGEETILIS